MKFLIALLIFVGLIFGAYKYFLSGGPRDLGVKYTPADYQTTHEKFGISVGSLPSAASIADSLQFTGKKDINLNLNSTEITAYISAEKWKYAPISNLQVRINPDGTGEISGLLHLSNLLPYISMTTPVADVQKAIDKYHISGTPPFYVKGKLTVTNNQVDMDIQSLEVGRIPVPANYISQNTASLNNFVSARLNAVPNLMVRSLNLSDGQVHLDASVPEKALKLEK